MNKRIKKKREKQRTKKRVCEHKGHTLIQSEYNNHYVILDADGKLKMHCLCASRLSKKEMKEHIEFYLDLIARESARQRDE